MTSYPKVTHSLVNVIIVTLYLGCLVVGGGNAEDNVPLGDEISHDDSSNHDGHGIIIPADPYPLVGETVRLNCTVKPTYRGQVNVSAMYFTKTNKKPIPNSELHVLSNDTVQLVWYNVTEEDSGYVHCHMDDMYLIATDVNVGSLPERVENVSCIIYNGKSMNCSWCPDGMPTTTTWIPIFSLERDIYQECFEPTKKPMCWCYWPSYDDLAEDQWSNALKMNMDYTLVVQAMNIWSQKRNITTITTFDIDTRDGKIVKPDPVKNLATIVLSSTSINVTWERPEGLTSSVEVEYQLEYTSEWNKSTISNIPGRGMDGIVSYPLVNLHPYTEYKITVRCMPKQGGFWSEGKSKNGTTKEAAPSAPPKLTVGGFRIEDSACNTTSVRYCRVTIMWKGIKKYHQNGVIQSYTLEIRTGGSVIRLPKLSNKAYQYTVSLLNNETHSVSVTGKTSAGESPPGNTIWSFSPELIPKNVVPEIHNGMVNIWWKKRNDMKIDNYTIFYCTEEKDQGIISCGDGGLESFLVSGDKTYASTPYNQNYLYSMAANSGHQSSGMTKNWFCLYHYDGVIPDVDFIFAKEQRERSLTIDIKTKLTCKEQASTGRILRYNISVSCANSSQSCSEESKTTISSDKGLHVIENLKPNTEYVVNVTGIGNSKTKSQSRPYRTKESAPAKPPFDVAVEPLHCHVILVTWSPPPKEDWNGEKLSYIVKYWVLESSTATRKLESKPTTFTSLNITKEIYGDTIYSISVIANTSGGRSKPSTPKVTRTEVCEPSSPSVNKVDILNSSQVEMRWSRPERGNGPVIAYKVFASYQTDSGRGNQSWNTTSDKDVGRFTMVCPDDVTDHLLVNYTISAVTQDPDTKQIFEGLPSSPVTKPMCKPVPPYDIVPLAVGVTIAGLIAGLIIVGLIVFFKCKPIWHQWIKGGKPEEPPVIPDFEKPDDLTSISTDPAYIDDWVQNLLVYVDSTPLIDDSNKEIVRDDYSEYRMDSGGSVGSRIFIEGFRTEKTNSGTYVEGEAPTSNAEETEHIYRKGQPDTLDETRGLVNSDFSSTVFTEDETNNVGIGLQNQAYEGQSDSSGIHSDKTSDSDSKNTSCASSGIGPEPVPCNKAPLGSHGLFALLTSDDLSDPSDSEEGGYISTRKSNGGLEEVTGQEDTYDNSADSCVNSELYSNSRVPQVPNSQISLTKQELNRWVEADEKQNSPDIERQLNVCASCRKRHEPNKCGLTSPELRAHQSDRQQRLDSSCSDESIPMGLLNNSTSDFSVDTSPCINSKLQLTPHLLTPNSNATSC